MKEMAVTTRVTPPTTTSVNRCYRRFRYGPRGRPGATAPRGMALPADWPTIKRWREQRNRPRAQWRRQWEPRHRCRCARPRGHRRRRRRREAVAMFEESMEVAITCDHRTHLGHSGGRFHMPLTSPSLLPPAMPPRVRRIVRRRQRAIDRTHRPAFDRSTPTSAPSDVIIMFISDVRALSRSTSFVSDCIAVSTMPANVEKCINAPFRV